MRNGVVPGARTVPAGAPGRLPRPDIDSTLGNGLRVVICSTRIVPLAEIRLTVPHSATRSAQVGLCQLLAATLLHGTARRDGDDYDLALATHGATLHAVSDATRLTVAGHTMAGSLPAVLALLAEAVREPRFTEEVIAPERERLARRIQLATRPPAALAQYALLRRRYGAATAARWQPRSEQVTACTAEELARIHAQHMGADGSILVLVGDLRPAKTLATVEELLGSWEPGPGGDVPEVPPWFAGGPLSRVNRPGAVQSTIRLAAPALPRTDPGYPALHLAQLVFGGSFDSRLVRRLREDKGYAYQVGSGVESVPGAATLMVEADTATEHTIAALEVIEQEMERMVAEPPSIREIDAARSFTTGSTATAMSAPGALATGLANLLHNGVGSDWLHNWGPALARVSYDAVGVAARRFFRPPDFTGVLVADEAALPAPAGKPTDP